MMPRPLRSLVLFGLALAIVAACTAQPLPSGKKAQSPLKIAYSPWPGNLPIAIAQAKGFFKQQGVAVDLVFSAQGEATTAQMADYAAGKLDGVTLALGSVVSVSGKNPTVRIVAVMDESAGADAIVAQPSIRSIADLKGKRVGVGLGGFGELFMTQILQMHGLTSDAVTLVKVDQEKVPDRLKSQDIQAGHTWEPYVSQSMKQSQARVLATSKETPGLVPDVLTFSGAAIRDRPAEVKAFLKAWFQAVDFWLANPTEGNQLITQTLKLDPKTVSLDGIKLFNLKDNLTAFVPGKDTRSIEYTTRLYSDFFVRTGNLDKPVNRQLLDASFISSLAKGN